jgi:CRP/FNR family transcriptional regulator, cyclic AMP receptor protein
MFTVNEAAEKLNLDPSQVRRLLRSGKLKGQKWGRDWMVYDLPPKKNSRNNGEMTSISSPEIKNDFKYSRKDVINLLKNTPILAGIDASKLEELAKDTSQLHFANHQIILREEETLDACYIIARGRVKVYKASLSGREFIIDILDPGNVFGIGSVISGFNYSGVVQAIKETDAISIPKDAFQSFASRNPSVMGKVVHLERARISDLFSKIINLMTVKTDQRVIKTINELGQRYGNILPFTHQEIGEMSGTTNETVTRILVKLKNRGALKLGRGNIEVVEHHTLSI